MPKEEVKEEAQEEKGSEEKDDKALKEKTGTEEETGEFSDFFLESVTELEKSDEKGDKKPEKEKPKKEKPEETKEEKAEREKKELDEILKETNKKEEKSDELGDRGQEIIDQEEEEAKRAEEEEVRLQAEKETAKQKAESSNIPPLTGEGAKIIMGMIPKGRFPEKLTVDIDGRGEVELDLKGFLEDNPESALINSLQTQEYLLSLLNRGVLSTKKQTEAEINKLIGQQADEIFGLKVMMELQNMEIFGIDLEKISESKELKEWGGKQDKTITALFRSVLASDYAKGIARYLKEADLIKAKTKATELDEKALKEKKEHDELHSMTMKGKGTFNEASIDDDSGSDEERQVKYKKFHREAVEALEKEP